MFSLDLQMSLLIEYFMCLVLAYALYIIIIAMQFYNENFSCEFILS